MIFLIFRLKKSENLNENEHKSSCLELHCLICIDTSVIHELRICFLSRVVMVQNKLAAR